MKFTLTDEKPVAARTGGGRELSKEESEVLEAFRQSIANGSELSGGLVGKSVVVELPTMAEGVELKKKVAKAATIEDHGYRFRVTPLDNGKFKVVFWAVELPEREYVRCDVCGKNVRVTADNKVGVHGPRENRCTGSSVQLADA